MVKRTHHEGITRVDPGKKPGGAKGAGHRSAGKGPHGAAKMPERHSKGLIGTHEPKSSGPKGGYPMGAASGYFGTSKGGRVRGG